jgi:type IV pilus biogenesis protein CpaD/CtpE
MKITISRFKPDGSEKTAEEMGDEIADALEAAGIDPSSLRITGVSTSDYGPNAIPVQLRCVIKEYP